MRHSLIRLTYCIWAMHLAWTTSVCIGQTSEDSLQRSTDSLLSMLEAAQTTQTTEPGSNAAELIDAFRLILEPSPRLRHRFLITDQAAVSRGVSKQILDFLETIASAQEFRKHLNELSSAYSNAGKSASFAKDWELAYRNASYASGVRSILPGKDGTVRAGTKDWIQRVSRSNTNHPKTLWPAGSYSIIVTEHFEIASQAPSKQAEDIAEICERTYSVWKQLFVDYWFEGSNSTNLDETSPGKKFSVAIYRDKNAYVKALQGAQKNISISTGFYEPNRQVALFYWDGNKTQPTIVHELVHQFFFESGAREVAFNTDTHAGFWAIEGIALYFESMSFRQLGGSTLVDVGGWDASRFQAARYRRLHDQYWIDWDTFRSANGQQFRRQKDISAWYSQATGLTHLWMDSSPEQRRAFTKYLNSIYAGREDASILGAWNSDEELRTAYDRFLLTGPRYAPKRPFFSNRKEVVLSRCSIQSDEILAWPEAYRTMTWLDLSFCPIDDSVLLGPNQSRSPAWNIGRLNLESTKVTDRSLEAISTMRELTELDLSSCQISDEGIAKLRGNKQLKILWLTDCPVTDQSVDVFLTLPLLEQLHLKGTKITSSGWAKLITSRPRLKGSSTGP